MEWLDSRHSFGELKCELMQLELNIISAQDLKKKRFSGQMQAYAVAWIKPDIRFVTHVDTTGGSNPTWNCTLTFQVEKQLLSQETSGMMIEIYNRGRVRDSLVGTAGVLLSNLTRRGEGYRGAQLSALQIRRRSGRAHGILNIGSMLLECCTKSSSIKEVRGSELDWAKILVPGSADQRAVGYKLVSGEEAAAQEKQTSRQPRRKRTDREGT